ncbi:hypothetical protein G6F22_019869 [Rhizopus arrhizus]|nr:hypothetical protein G6F22_019869 [Rhizopus arrhizus]
MVAVEPPGLVRAVEAVEQARQMLRRYGFAGIAHGDLHFARAALGDADVDRAALVGIAHCIRHQVRHGPLKQPAVDGGGGPTQDANLQPGLQGFRLVVLTDFLDHAGQIALPAGAVPPGWTPGSRAGRPETDGS